MIHIIRTRATKAQIDEMLETLSVYIKLAVDSVFKWVVNRERVKNFIRQGLHFTSQTKTLDIRRAILAGGGEFHADCETALLEDGSQQADIGGADWYPDTQTVTYESLINIRPRQNNRSMEILNPEIREQVAQIVQNLLGGV